MKSQEASRIRGDSVGTFGSRTLQILGVVGLVGLVGCKGNSETIATPAASNSQPLASASAAASGSGSSTAEGSEGKAPSAAARSRDFGPWKGTYQSELHPVAMPKEDGPPSAWKKDPGQVGTGPGRLALEVASDGTVHGTGEGPLGAFQIVGATDDDVLGLAIEPIEPLNEKSFHGHATLHRDGVHWTGHLVASNGDSTLLRRASVTLVRGSQ